MVQLFEELKMSSKNPTSLGVLLRKLRLDTNINQEEMATILKISPSYLSAIENGNRRLSNNIKNRIKSILSPYYHDDEIQKAILLSDPKSTIEIDVPPLRNQEKLPSVPPRKYIRNTRLRNRKNNVKIPRQPVSSFPAPSYLDF